MDCYSPTRTSFRWLGYNAGFHALRAVGTRMIGMRYEDLVTEPEAQFSAPWRSPVWAYPSSPSSEGAHWI